MVNSILDNLTPSDIISEIKLLMTANKDELFLLVEGLDDVKLFRPLFSEKVHLIKSGSKTNVDNIVSAIKNNRIIGIRDKDYSKKPKLKRIFYCDFCCAEMMIISFKDCFERLYCDFYNGKELTQNLKLTILKQLEFISKLRMLNEQNTWNIKFDGIKVNRLYNKDIDIMNIGIVDEINKHNPSNILDKSRLNLLHNLPVLTNENELLYITNGHDFIMLFSKICNECSLDQIVKCLHGCFNQTIFSQTNLFQNIKKYQETNNYNILQSI